MKHSFKINDEVAIVEIKDESDSDYYCGTFKIKNYSYRGYKGYKLGDEQFQNEVGIITRIENNEITVQITEKEFVTVPYFCLIPLKL